MKPAPRPPTPLSLLVPSPEWILFLTLSYGYCSTAATCHQGLTRRQALYLTSAFLLMMAKCVSPAQTSPMNFQASTAGCLPDVVT